jgi:CheY-like chemotaxis protein
VVQGRGGAKPLAGRRIIWVDASPTRSSFTIGILEQVGATVETVLCAEGALSVMDKGNAPIFDLVVCHLRLLDNSKGGIDLATQLRAQHYRGPVVVYSDSIGVRDYGGQAREAGATLTSSATSHLLRHVSDALA